MQTVRKFVEQSYSLISSHSPTVPLHGDDLSLGIATLNRLLNSYASTGLFITIAKTVTTTLAIGQQEVTFGDSTSSPDIVSGRLAHLDNAWLILENVTYPLVISQKAEFLAAWKYEPLSGLPRFAIVFPEVDITRVRIYPSASQPYQFYARGKFQLPNLDSNDDMSLVPAYYHRFLQLALAKDLSVYKGRAEAWSQMLESMLSEERMNIVATSEVNLSISGERDSLLNGASRIRAGV